MSSPHQFVLSCVGKKIPESFISNAVLMLKTHHLRFLEQVQTSKLTHSAFDLRFESDSPKDSEQFKKDLIRLSDEYQIDLAFMEDGPGRKNKKLIVFDMDSTLIQHEVINEMAAVCGIEPQIALITERAMNGELDFDEALRARVALLKGLKKKDMENIYSHLKLMPGARELIQFLKAHGYKTAIASGGFKFFAENFAKDLGIDYVYANDLSWDQNDCLTGDVAGTIVNAQRKAQVLEELAKKENLSLEQTIAVGDGANDLLMLAKAGMGIAYHAKEKVKHGSRHHIGHGPLTTILYFLGYQGDFL